MSIEIVLSDYLAQCGIADTIYTGFLPAQPDNAVCVVRTAGFPPDMKHQYKTTGIQVRTRSRDYPHAENTALFVQNELHALGVTTISGIHITSIAAEQDIFFLGKDELDRHQFAQNFIVDYYAQLQHRPI